jgi:hypothetical protein
MGHVGPDNDTGVSLRTPLASKIDGFEESMTGEKTYFAESMKVVQGFPGTDRKSQESGIRGHYQIIFESSLQAETRNSEAGVLVNAGSVQIRICGFRDAPRYPFLLAVMNLKTHRFLAGYAQKRVFISSEEELGHQVLEHGPTPTEQDTTTANGAVSSSQRKPMVHGDIALGDSDETCKPGFTGKKIIIAIIETLIGNAIADMKQPLSTIVEKVHFRAVSNLITFFDDQVRFLDELSCLHGVRGQ